MRITYLFRLYPTRRQTEAMTEQLREACALYNAALQDRRDAWKLAKKSVTYYDQANQLKEIRAEGFTKLANFSCCQAVLRRLDRAFDGFFRRVKSGETPGFPRFKPHRTFDSITFPSYGDGCRLKPSGRLYLQGIGDIKVKLHRPVEGKIKTVTLKRKAGHWYVCFSVEREATTPLPISLEAVGIDMGLTSFAVLSDGTVIHNPRHYKESQNDLRKDQRRVARRKKGSQGRRDAVLQLQKTHEHIRNQRDDFQHKLAHALVSCFGLIAIEDLNLKGLVGGMLAKPFHDAGIADFFHKLTYKAESAGRLLVAVDPRGTSQRCSRCGAEVRKALKERWHECGHCGLSVGRDLNSAIEILRLGRSLAGLTWEIAPCVPAEAGGF